MLSSEHSHHILKRRLINFRVVELSRLAASYRLSQLLMIVSENKTQRSFPEINKKQDLVKCTWLTVWLRNLISPRGPMTMQEDSRQKLSNQWAVSPYDLTLTALRSSVWTRTRAEIKGSNITCMSRVRTKSTRLKVWKCVSQNKRVQLCLIISSVWGQNRLHNVVYRDKTPYSLSVSR